MERLWAPEKLKKILKAVQGLFLFDGGNTDNAFLKINLASFKTIVCFHSTARDKFPIRRHIDHSLYDQVSFFYSSKEPRSSSLPAKFSILRAKSSRTFSRKVKLIIDSIEFLVRQVCPLSSHEVIPLGIASRANIVGRFAIRILLCTKKSRGIVVRRNGLA